MISINQRWNKVDIWYTSQNALGLLRASFSACALKEARSKPRAFCDVIRSSVEIALLGHYIICTDNFS